MPDEFGFDVTRDPLGPRYCHRCDTWFSRLTPAELRSHARAHDRQEKAGRQAAAAEARRKSRARLRELNRLRRESPR